MVQPLEFRIYEFRIAKFFDFELTVATKQPCEYGREVQFLRYETESEASNGGEPAIYTSRRVEAPRRARKAANCVARTAITRRSTAARF